jgi:hypothetical protein
VTGTVTITPFGCSNGTYDLVINFNGDRWVDVVNLLMMVGDLGKMAP